MIEPVIRGQPNLGMNGLIGVARQHENESVSAFAGLWLEGDLREAALLAVGMNLTTSEDHPPILP